MYFRKIVFYLVISFLGGFVLNAEQIPALYAGYDTINPPVSTFKKNLDKAISSKAFQMTYIGVPLIIGGIIVKNEDDHFHDLRNSYIPKFQNHYDDYLQYAPAIAMLGLKVAGVEGRSSWGRMLVSDAFSAGLMALTVNSLKYSVKVRRPDGSTRNSFPSGHSATAFMAATMLHKEYGLTQSPWYSIGGYTVATATAVSRMMNNRHWLSDVMVGAGIGILSTEIGYLLADLIFKDKGLKHELLNFSNFDYERPPSFFGLYMGFNFMPIRFGFSSDIKLKASPGTNVGFQGAWFANRNWGVGGRLSVASMPLSLTKPIPDYASPEVYYQVDALESGPLDIISGYVGPYLSVPLSSRCLWSTKLLVGCNFIPSNSINLLYKENQSPEIKKQEIAHVNHSYNIGYGTGSSVSYVLKQNLSVRVFMDYNVIPSRFTTFLVNEEKAFQQIEEHKTLQTVTLGASVNIMLW